MNKIYFFVIVICCYSIQLFSQEKHRRDNYFETFVEVKDSIDSIVVNKAKREMITFSHKKKVKMYIISLGMEPIGKKQYEGDLKTPEGLYYINTRSKESAYHSNLGISYPNEQDSLYAVKKNKKPGGDIKIHGFPNNHTKKQERELLNSDWTIGCIAVSDFEIDELYNWVVANCPILILP